MLKREPTGLRKERILSSPRYVDGGFRNTSPVGPGLKRGTALPVMSEYFFKEGRRTPLAPLPSHDPRETWLKKPDSGLRVTWLGHSTMLIEIDGVRLLTDPVWGERASPSRLVGPKRFQPVPITIAQLPPVDAVIVSHDHYDHLDYPSVVALAKLKIPFITSLGVGSHLEAFGVAPELITELDWWEHTQVRNVQVSAAPSQHFSGRGLTDRNHTLWSSFVARSDTHGVFFSGDTGLTQEYGEIRSKLGPFDLVMLEVGAFHPAWGDIHLGPDNAAQAHALLGGGAFLPVHWGTFNLAIHSWDDPAERLLEIQRERDLALLMPQLGVPVEPKHVGKVDPWWRAISGLEKNAPKEPPTETTPEASLADPID
jgi:L-ascorbate metabolism protein UlaG (beta-lactamase superfamily)